MSTYIPIGKRTGPHGWQGELLLQHQLGKRSTLSGVKAIFIEDKKGQFLPWFIEKAQARNEAETLLKIEGISSKEQAQQLARKAVWLAEADFEKQAAYQAKIRNCHGVIVGHIHTPVDIHINDIHYLNCGDWIENNSYIIYNKKSLIPYFSKFNTIFTNWFKFTNRNRNKIYRRSKRSLSHWRFPTHYV